MIINTKRFFINKYKNYNEKLLALQNSYVNYAIGDEDFNKKSTEIKAIIDEYYQILKDYYNYDINKE